jgi:hypothetical protein
MQKQPGGKKAVIRVLHPTLAVEEDEAQQLKTCDVFEAEVGKIIDIG